MADLIDDKDCDNLTPHEVAEIIKLGQAAWFRIKKRAIRSFPDWMTFAGALHQGKIAVAKELRMNTPDNQSTIFVRAFKRWREGHKFGDAFEGNTGKVEMSRLFWLFERREEVLAWFNHLSAGEQVRLHTPSSAFNRYKKHLAAAQEAEEKTNRTQEQRKADEVEEAESAAARAMARAKAAQEAADDKFAEAYPKPRQRTLDESNEMVALAFFAAHGDRVDAILKAILKMRRERRNQA
jgi:hypothetical protein